MKKPFPDRFNLRSTSPIVVREDAPEAVRHGVFLLLSETSLKPFQLHRAVYKALRLPSKNNNKEDHVFLAEVQEAINSCKWYEVYASIEEVHHLLHNRSHAHADEFSSSVNTFLRERGVGLELRDGTLDYRGDTALTEFTEAATQMLIASDRVTALSELQEAITDIRRLPIPEVTGAIQHSMGALECLARDLVQDNKITLGKLVKKYGTLLPTTVASMVDKAYGFASDEARHLREGENVDFAEAELVVGLTATVVTYLLRVEVRNEEKN